MEARLTAADLRIVPANEASAQDLRDVFGTADYPFYCQCQRFKVTGWLWRDTTIAERIAMQHAATQCGKPEAAHTSGLVAFLGDDAIGWVAVEPRTAYPKLRTSRVPWSGRKEDKDDASVWAITCFCVRKGYRGRGITYALAEAAAQHAQARGATAVEGYPMTAPDGKDVTWGELHVGKLEVFEAAGFVQVSAPNKRRRVVRRDD